MDVTNIRLLSWAFKNGVFEWCIVIMAGLSFLIIFAIEWWKGDKKNDIENELDRRKQELKTLK